MKDFRILLLNASAIYGGGEFYVLQLAGELKKRGHFVIVGCRNDNLLFEKCRNSEIKAEHINFKENGSKGLIGNIKRIKHLCITDSVNIVHTNTGIDRTAGAIAAKLAKAKHVTSCHSLVSIKRNITHYIRNKNYTDAFIADGRTVKALLTEKDGIAEDRVYAINNGIPPEEFRRDENTRGKIRKLFGIGINDIVIGNAARMVYFKGHKYLLTAFANICSKFDNVKLLLAGDGELENELQSYAAVLKISDKVIFSGFSDNLNEIYSAVDIYVQPSVSGGGELIPFTVLYAMAQKIPVIASGIGEMPYMVEDGKTGFIIDEKSPFRISEKLEELISNPELRFKFGNAGFDKLINEYSIEAMTEGTEKLYYKLLGGSEK